MLGRMGEVELYFFSVVGSFLKGQCYMKLR
jgi:hypothetical protein